jgi:hypothetical protein
MRKNKSTIANIQKKSEKAKFLNKYLLIFQKRLGNFDYQALKITINKKIFKNYELFILC